MLIAAEWDFLLACVLKVSIIYAFSRLFTRDIEFKRGSYGEISDELDIWEWLATCLFIVYRGAVMSEELREDLTKIIDEFEKKCQQSPNNVMAHHHLGLVYLKAGRVDEAIKMLERAIAIDPMSGESMINLGAIYFSKGDIAKAQELNEEAIRVMPETAQAHANLGLIWQQRNELDKAIAAYDKAIQYNPKLSTVWVNLTSVLTMKGEDERALKSALRGVEIDPDSPLAQNNLAVALFFSGEYKLSKEHMEKARELGYSVDPNFVNRLSQELA